MGVDYSVCLGPYVECEVFLQEVTRAMRTCPKEDCPQHKQHMYREFCDRCGSPISTMDYTCKDYYAKNWPSVDEMNDDAWDEFNNYFTSISLHPYEIYVPNTTFKNIENRKSLWFDPCSVDEIVQPVDSELIEKELAAFKEQFAEQIKQLEDWYGSENVNIKWGLLSWA